MRKDKEKEKITEKKEDETNEDTTNQKNNDSPYLFSSNPEIKITGDECHVSCQDMNDLIRFINETNCSNAVDPDRSTLIQNIVSQASEEYAKNVECGKNLSDVNRPIKFGPVLDIANKKWFFHVSNANKSPSMGCGEQNINGLNSSLSFNNFQKNSRHSYHSNLRRCGEWKGIEVYSDELEKKFIKILNQLTLEELQDFFDADRPALKLKKILSEYDIRGQVNICETSELEIHFTTMNQLKTLEVCLAPRNFRKLKEIVQIYQDNCKCEKQTDKIFKNLVRRWYSTRGYQYSFKAFCVKEVVNIDIDNFFSGKNLNCFVFKKKGNQKIDFTEFNLSKTNFSFSDVKEAKFFLTNLHKADFTNSKFDEKQFIYCYFLEIFICFEHQNKLENEENKDIFHSIIEKQIDMIKNFILKKNKIPSTKDTEFIDKHPFFNKKHVLHKEMLEIKELKFYKKMKHARYFRL